MRKYELDEMSKALQRKLSNRQLLDAYEETDGFDTFFERVKSLSPQTSFTHRLECKLREEYEAIRARD